MAELAVASAGRRLDEPSFPRFYIMAKVKYEVIPDRNGEDEWRVEGIDYDNEGRVYVAIFCGSLAEEHAREYAEFKNR